MRFSVQVLALLCFSAALSGCGNGKPVAKRSAEVRGVIASASDCVSFGSGAVEACGRAIERAVEAHEAGSETHTSLEACESAVGARSCERTPSGHYRIRLVAFMVTLGASPKAEALYPIKDGGKVGFQTARKDTLLASDRSLTFSRLALSVAEMHAASDGKRKRSRS